MRLIQVQRFGFALLLLLAGMGRATADDLAELANELALQQSPTTSTAPSQQQPRPPTTPSQTALNATSPYASRTSLMNLPQNRAPHMLGDFFVGRMGINPVQLTTVSTDQITTIIISPTGIPIQVTTSQTVLAHEQTRVSTPAASRSFKVADNESPQPQDRIFLDFNCFDDYGKAINRSARNGVSNLREYRETFGLEKTLCCGYASLGMRLPLHTISGESVTPELGGTDTDIGDLSLLFKYALYRDWDCGDTFSVGLAITTPTGSDVNNPFHGAVLQPWFGYLWTFGHWYLHGFSAVDVPMDGNDATLLLNDVGVGYYLHHDVEHDRPVTAVAPTVEVHVNTPLNHHGAFRFNDLAGTPDTVDLTVGTMVEFRRTARLTLGVVTPVSGPRPFDVELVAFLNMFY